MEPRIARRQERRMPCQGIIAAGDQNLVGDPRRAQVDLELGHRPVMTAPVQFTFESLWRAGDEKATSNFAGRGRPAPAKNECGDRPRRRRLELKPIEGTGIRPRRKDPPTRIFTAFFDDMELIKEHGRGPARPGRVRRADARNDPFSLKTVPARGPVARSSVELFVPASRATTSRGTAPERSL